MADEDVLPCGGCDLAGLELVSNINHPTRIREDIVNRTGVWKTESRPNDRANAATAQPVIAYRASSGQPGEQEICSRRVDEYQSRNG